VNEFANPSGRTFFNYSKTGTQTTATISIDKLHDQNDNDTELIRISGGKFTFLPPLKYVQADYKHIATENLLAGIVYPQGAPFVFGPVDSQNNDARMYVSGLFSYAVTERTDPPGLIGLWFVFGIRIQVENNYLSRPITFNGSNINYSQAIWTTTNTDRYKIPLFVPENEQTNFADISFLTDVLPQSGVFTFDITLDEILDVNGQQLPLGSFPPGLITWAVDNLIVEHLYEGTFSSQSDIRRFRANNDVNGNSAAIEIETILGDGIGVNSPGHLSVLDDNAEWVIAENWRVGNTGAFQPFTALLCAEIIRGQLKPIRKFNGEYINKNESLYRAHNVIDHVWGKLILMGGDFDLYLDSSNGIWVYIQPEITGWTQATAIDYPQGEGLDRGTPRLRTISKDDDGIANAEEFFREDFTGITDEITVTVNNGVLPTDAAKIQLFKNGELQNPDTYTISGNVITLTSSADPLDEFEVLFSTVLGYTPPGTFFRQRFNNVTDDITITANNGILPTDKEQIVVFQNGNLINPTAYTVAGSVITLEYPAFEGDIVEVLFPFPFGQIHTGTTYREQITNVTDTITPTGILPQNLDAIQIYQNGLLLQDEYYTIAGNAITLLYTAETTDTFTIIYQK